MRRVAEDGHARAGARIESRRGGSLVGRVSDTPPPGSGFAVKVKADLAASRSVGHVPRQDKGATVGAGGRLRSLARSLRIRQDRVNGKGGRGRAVPLSRAGPGGAGGPNR